jgi:hypothetical protein
LQQIGKTVNLRAHHLLCTRTFSGAGYNQAFIDNMRRVVDACMLVSCRIKIVAGLDDICAFCPHSNGQLCKKSGSKAPDMDKEVLNILGIKTNDTYTAVALDKKIRNAVRRGLFRDICSRCEWFKDYCRPIIDPCCH